MPKSVYIFIVSLFAYQGFALPLPKAPRALMSLPPSFTTNYDFEGIVQLSNCSGSLVRFEGSKDSDMAMILTNGHCLETGFPKPGSFVYHQRSSRSFRLMDSGRRTTRVTATMVIYSTMTTTDITLYQLTQTFAAIQAATGVRPFTLASKHPDLQQPIDIISGYWSRGYSCSIESFAYQLKEDLYTWTDSMRYTRPGCDVIGGTSGSPVIATGTRTVIGINNTGNDDGEKCTENNPCEVDPNGNISFQKGYSYAQETYTLYTCLNPNNDLDLMTPGCALPH